MRGERNDFTKSLAPIEVVPLIGSGSVWGMPDRSS